MTTATMHRRPDNRSTGQGLFALIAAALGEIYGRVGSTEPRSEIWHYYAA